MPAPIVPVDEDEECSFCLDRVEDSNTYYCPPCGHFFCYLCMDQNAMLNRCTRCDQEFFVAYPVTVKIPINVD